VRPAKNISTAPPGKNDVATLYAPPADVRRALEVGCYDCHSNNTRYPWYAQIQPVGWWLAQHIRNGKSELNFSEIGTYSPRTQAKKFAAISDQVEGRDMPLKSYTWIHRDAVFTAAQIKAITDWADEQHDKLAPEK
jgi:hypothetical protein